MGNAGWSYLKIFNVVTFAKIYFPDKVAFTGLLYLENKVLGCVYVFWEDTIQATALSVSLLNYFY